MIDNEKQELERGTRQRDLVSEESLTCPHEYVLIENDIIFNDNATILLHLHMVFVPVFVPVFVLFSYRFQPSTRKR